MNAFDGSVPKQRNRNYEDTHQLLIEKAAELIVESGADGVSVSALARVTGINRSTIYYHFDTRESLMSAAEGRLRKQTPVHGDAGVSRWVGIDNISECFRSNPEVIASWIDRSIADGDVRERYPQWDRLVAQIAGAYAELSVEEPCDADVYCALILSSAFTIPRSFTNEMNPFDSLDRILDWVHARAAEYSAAKGASAAPLIDWPTLYAD